MKKRYLLLGVGGAIMLYFWLRSRSSSVYSMPSGADPGTMFPFGDTKKESEVGPSVIVYDIPDWPEPPAPPVINYNLMPPVDFFNGGAEVTPKTPQTYGLGYAQTQPKPTTKKEAQAIVKKEVSEKIPGPIGQKILEGWLK